MEDNKTQLSPRIASVPEGIRRPLWSVMIPTYNPGERLRRTLQSVLAQDAGPEQMEVGVVDNCSTTDYPERVLCAVGGGRVSFYRRATNDGAIANFNECIGRSRGHLIHILHADDYVLPGFYKEIERLAGLHADSALLATRCFCVDESEIIIEVSRRILELENGGKSPAAFFYDTGMPFPGVVIRRGFYEASGGFIPSLVHTADREMWARAVSEGGGVISPRVFACYEMSGLSDTSRVKRSGENVNDLLRLSGIFQKRYAGFSSDRARRQAAYMALDQAKRFAAIEDRESAEKNWELWRQSGFRLDRFKEALRPFIRKTLGRAHW